VSKLSGDTIKFGATVRLVDKDTNEERVWQLVGEPGADAHKGKISGLRMVRGSETNGERV
jgi:transcription elongation factor GreA